MESRKTFLGLEILYFKWLQDFCFLLILIVTTGNKHNQMGIFSKHTLLDIAKPQQQN